MGRPRSGRKTRNIRVTEAAFAAASAATELSGETLVDLVSRIVKGESERVIDEGYRRRMSSRAALLGNPDF